ncbi:MAG: hypothetical protein CM15mP1_3330 [Methanobacteriota archaeon]|nr:MAG: hypothetical protein CM15mP1_3330 [Euryarchaeota archaeon]
MVAVGFVLVIHEHDLVVQVIASLTWIVVMIVTLWIIGKKS